MSNSNNWKKETFVKIEDVQGQSQEMISQMNDLGGRLNDLEKRAKSIEFVVDVGKVVIIGVVVVFFLAFLTFVFDAWKLYRDAYHEYKATIQNLIEERDVEKERKNSDKLDHIIKKLEKLNVPKSPEPHRGSSK